MEGRIIELLEAILIEQKATNEELRKITRNAGEATKERMADAQKMMENLLKMVPGMGGQNGQ